VPRKRTAWHKTVEEAGVSVRLYEKPSGIIYRDVYADDGTRDRKSLGHSDRKLAEQQARALAKRLGELRHAGQVGTLKFGQLLLLYERHRFPLLSRERQRAVRGMAVLLEHHFGRDLPVDDLSPQLVEAYVVARRSGKVRSERHRTPELGVRTGTIRNELHLLGAMIRWAQGHRMGGRTLLARDPLIGMTIPQEKNAKRPIATEERFLALSKVADQVDPLGRFACMLALARHTGRRISAIAQLRAADVLRSPEQVERALGAAGMDMRHAAQWPFGALVWPAATDKLGFESVTPIGRDAREALDTYLRAHPRVGDAPLFPSTGDNTKAVHKVHAGHWLRRAETLAGLTHAERGGWHCWRRLWASERRHLPAQDVAAAGGWRSLQVMRSAYQQADAAMVYAVLDPAAALAQVQGKRRSRHRTGTARN
jgi:hypothetical protein